MGIGAAGADRLRDQALAQLATLVEASDDAISAETPDAIITIWNPAAERLYGYTAEEAIGRSVAILIPPDYSAELPRILERLRRGQRIGHYETVRLRKDHVRIHVSVSISPILDAAGRVSGSVSVARDVTERKRADEERRQLLLREQAALAEARAALAIRDQFLSFAAHELRTPLTSLRGNIQLANRRLTRGMSADLILEALERAEGQVDRLGRLVRDLLDVSRIGAGRVVLQREPIPLESLAQRTVEVVRDAEPSRRIDLLLPPRSLVVDGDAERLEQVLINLLQNAIKYSPPEAPVAVRLESGRELARLAVEDHGIGIPAEDLPHVFDRFHRAGNVDLRSVSGLGLGLYIARGIVEAHGGRLMVASVAGQGSTFTIHLPLVRSRQTPAELQPEPVLPGVSREP
jgi:PAS domain S-box-containing protein